MSKQAKVRTVGPWAKEKLQALGDYLDFYTKVLKNQGHWLKGTIFVDAFAGGGQSKVRRAENAELRGGLFISPPDAEVEEYIKGSPRVALDITNPFSRYVFIEQNAKRAAQLEKLKREYRDRRRIEIRRGNADEEIVELLSEDLGRSDYRGVVFLDPFGMHVAWSTIARLAATRRIEVLINFGLNMAIQRYLSRDANIDDAHKDELDRYFGTSEWFNQAFDGQSGLLITTTVKRPDSSRRLLKLYRDRLKSAFGHVSTARLIRNSHGGHLYYLIWAGPHRKGLEGAEYILSRGERLDRATFASA